jgi:REP element-mobilizing transposase RayT
MARPLRLEYAGALYHVTARGHERKELFCGEEDQELLRQKLAASVGRYQVRLYAYTLMSNHFHLLLETPRGNLSRFMQHLNGSYTSYFNRRHQRQGHLFEERFKARLVEETGYLLRLTRYVHLNPVKIARIRSWALEEKVKYLRGYRWSSYRSYAGLEERAAFVDYSPLGYLIGEGKPSAARRYRRFVESGMAGTDEELAEALRLSSKAIGGQEFCRGVEERHEEQLERVGDPTQVSMRRVEVGADPERVLAAVARAFEVDQGELLRLRRRTPARLLAMKLLVELAGWKGREVAQRFGLQDASAISHCLKSWQQQREETRQLRICEEALRRQLKGI